MGLISKPQEWVCRGTPVWGCIFAPTCVSDPGQPWCEAGCSICRNGFRHPKTLWALPPESHHCMRAMLLSTRWCGGGKWRTPKRGFPMQAGETLWGGSYCRPVLPPHVCVTSPVAPGWPHSRDWAPDFEMENRKQTPILNRQVN